MKAAVLLLISMLGLARLPETFAGDQAMFVVFAKEINRGALLYRDVWDLKQPGIFLFYLAGGKLFGFSEFGIHLFELFYWLAFSAVLIVALKDYFRCRAFVLLTPLLTVGVYYAICGSWHLTQVEGLVGFPLFLTLLTAAKSTKAQSCRTRDFLIFLSGLAGGVVLVFKLVLLPIIALFWLMLLIKFAGRQREASLPKVLFRTLFAVLLGLAIPLAAVVVYFSLHGALALIIYTFFEYPPQAVTAFSGNNRLDELARGLHWSFIVFLPLLILIFAWALIFIKSLKIPNKNLLSAFVGKIYRMDLITAGLILWLFAGFGVILAQRLSWWEYHYLLLLVPLGILATKGIESVWRQITKIGAFFTKPFGKFIFIGCLIFLFLPILRLPVRKFKQDYFSESISLKERISAPNGDKNEQYRQIQSEVAFLFEPDSRPGKIFVCADPLYYYLSKRSPAIASNGWMPEFFLPEQWSQLSTELASKTPPYVVIENYCQDLIHKNSPKTEQIIRDKYFLRSVNKNVSWYQLASAPEFANNRIIY